MSEIASWFGSVAVTGIGVVTPVGLCAPASLAALRARISRIGDLPWFAAPNAEGEMQPVTGAQVPILPANRQGPARLLRLIEPALREALLHAGLKRTQRCGLFVGSACPNPGGRILSQGGLIQQAVLGIANEAVMCESAVLFENGRASALKALRMAVQELVRDKSNLDAVIVGGADSLISPRMLSFLKASGRLREGAKSTGILPGEGAAFLVLEKPENAKRRGAAALARFEAAAGGHDPVPLDKPTRAVVLGRVFRAIAAEVKDGPLIIISDLNGERQRAYEWMFASCRAPFHHGGTPHWRMSESIGDSGAATGAIACAWAIEGFQKRYCNSDQAVIWGASDEGAREAVVLKSASESN